MRIIGGNLPGVEDPVSECALHVHGEQGTCALDSDVKYLRKYLAWATKKDTEKLSKGEIVRQLKALLNVEKESDIWAHPQFRDFVGDDLAQQVLQLRFKPKGPASSTALLDNVNIDETLAQWSLYAEKLFNKKFYHVPFQMIDFAYTGGALADLDIAGLHKDGFKCFGVVINTDRSSGRGKHWFCLFGDLAHTGTQKDPITLEYFNSSGNPPMQEIAIWMEKMVFELLRDHGLHCDIIRSANQRLQVSHTECGMWSLLYIKSRLEGHPANWFFTVSANDQDMVEYRRHLFRQ